VLYPEQVFENFELWKNGSALSLSKEKEIVAFYPMNEKNGKIIHNAVGNQFHLSIPVRFKILKKNFLKLSRDSLKLDGSSLRDMRINILGFIPLGWLFFRVFNRYNQRLRIQLWRPMLLTVFGGTVISLMIEILQAFLPTRISSLSDLIFNTLGTALGVILALMFIKIKKTVLRGQQAES
jgi:VanZ family protein